MSKSTAIPEPVDRPVIVLVEGKDWLHFVGHLIKPFPALRTLIKIYDFCSVDTNPRKFLSALKIASGYESVRAIGIIRDSEEDYNSTEMQVCNAFRDEGFDVGARHGQIQGIARRIGYFIVPPNMPGCLETMCCAAASDVETVRYATAYVRECDRPQRNNNWRAKAIVHSVIATSERPGSPIGISLSLGLWNTGHPEIRALVGFIEALASESDSLTTPL